LGTAPTSELTPLGDYVNGTLVPISGLPHGWEFHSAVALGPAEERTIVREPVEAVPEAIAKRLGKVRVLAVPYIACTESGDAVARHKPAGETHTAAWVETPEHINLLLACRELDAHDTGFELLASLAELLLPRLTSDERTAYNRLLDEELRHGARGEIDEEAFAAKKAFLGASPGQPSASPLEHYRGVSFVSTAAEFMHGLWHDVQVRIGPEHLPVAQLRRRMTLLAELFPLNPGYRLFDESVEKAQ